METQVPVSSPNEQLVSFERMRRRKLWGEKNRRPGPNGVSSALFSSLLPSQDISHAFARQRSPPHLAQSLPTYSLRTQDKQWPYTPGGSQQKQVRSSASGSK